MTQPFDPSPQGQCANHSDRVGALAVELPSIGIRKFLCAECHESFLQTLAKAPYRNAGDDWLCEPDHRMIGESLYTRGGDGLYHCADKNSNERTWK